MGGMYWSAVPFCVRGRVKEEQEQREEHRRGRAGMEKRWRAVEIVLGPLWVLPRC